MPDKKKDDSKTTLKYEEEHFIDEVYVPRRKEIEEENEGDMLNG
tara:strand:- start:5563 stop:5694 length:132 start_codon:yes stop_codon:yes gene_type:complete